MTGHLDERQLNDCVDDALDPAEQDSARAHLAACDSCRDAVESLRLLRSDLAGLPRSIQPPAHVLMGVRAGLAQARNSAAARTWYMRPRLLAAAAILLVVISSATTALLIRGTPGSDAAPYAATPPTGSSSLVAVDALERSYEHEVAEVQRALAGQQSALSPETLRVLQANLDIIDRALNEARAALRADPGNDALTDLVRSGYERKLDVLRSVSSHGRASS
ncbi:MAG TPA: zf-HC2 domain-containing protein [Longimicrobiales bacterium]|nr:zf-HC2 domain-containing protein [Longimicrobiales bacterium]